MADRKRVLFLCVGNACRSQMAEGLLRHMAAGQFEVHSAGAVSAGVHPATVRMMAEIGIDITGQTSKRVEKYAESTFDYVITLCGEQDGGCPVFLGETGRQQCWPFDDPAAARGSEAEMLGVFRRVRDQIRARLVRFIREEMGVRWSLEREVEQWELRPR